MEINETQKRPHFNLFTHHNTPILIIFELDLTFACRYHHIESLSKLLEKYLSIEQTHTDGRTCLDRLFFTSTVHTVYILRGVTKA